MPDTWQHYPPGWVAWACAARCVHLWLLTGQRGLTAQKFLQTKLRRCMRYSSSKSMTKRPRQRAFGNYRTHSSSWKVRAVQTCRRGRMHLRVQWRPMQRISTQVNGDEDGSTTRVPLAKTTFRTTWYCPPPAPHGALCYSRNRAQAPDDGCKPSLPAPGQHSNPSGCKLP